VGESSIAVVGKALYDFDELMGFVNELSEGRGRPDAKAGGCLVLNW